jgi:proteasome lid subunit RPN8/RPN11
MREVKAQIFRVTAAVNQEIRRHGEETYPHECCGALVGTNGRTTATVALPNTTEEGPRRRFMVRPSDYRLAEQRAQELGGDLLGFYHSHPDHPARPSQYDLDHAWPTFAYIIVAVKGDHDEAGSRPRSDEPGSSRRSEQGSPRRSAEGAKAGDMTVWFLKEDRSEFEEGELNGD